MKDIIIQKEEANFTPINVVKLLDGKHKFVIPSFQRGYRWQTRQVEDLLNDLKNFVRSEDTQQSYFLQPLVVKSVGEDTYEVLDGQQRLTTLLLILKRTLTYLRSNDMNKFKDNLYEISYTSRPELDFDNPDPDDNIDSFHLFNAKETIDKWFGNLDDSADDSSADNIADSLFKNDNSKLVKFIWYCVDEDKEDVESIQIFNRLNRGKIKLTSSELIKALLILDSRSSLNKDKVALEWDIMEKKFQDDSFWYFISNKPENVQTRLDLLFDFVTCKGEKDSKDDDYSYRKFQNLYDYIHVRNDESLLDPLWSDMEEKNFEYAWKKVKQTYDVLVHWYEDKRFYHYIGFLVCCDDTPLQIYNFIVQNKSGNWDDDKTIYLLKKRIRSKFKIDPGTDFIDSLDYDTTAQDVLRKVLLLFNIETYQTKDYVRFPFDAFKKEHWDIEHVDSQTDHGMQKIEDKIAWLGFAIQSLNMDNDDEAKRLSDDCLQMQNKFLETQKDNNNEFDGLYRQIVVYYTRENNEQIDYDSINKNSIDNLTLLDSGTNRSYGNAPYPYKRAWIIRNDKEGKFVPICTKNLFLKYYSDIDKPDAQTLAIRWHSDDRRQYLAAIHKTLDPYFKTEEK